MSAWIRYAAADSIAWGEVEGEQVWELAAHHVAELGNEVPKAPMLFLKAPSSLIEPDETILLPTLANRSIGELINPVAAE